MKPRFFLLLFATFTTGSLTSCHTPRHDKTDGLKSIDKPLRSPVTLRDAVLTLPSNALSGLTQREAYLRERSGDFDEINRRIWLRSDNPYLVTDSKSMLFLRLFEDASGNTIAASHAARPFADNSEPSEIWTRVHRLTDGAWVDVTETAFAGSIPRNAYFRFDGAGTPVSYGLYKREPRHDGRLSFYNFGPRLGQIAWRDGAFHVASGTKKQLQ